MAAIIIAVIETIPALFISPKEGFINSKMNRSSRCCTKVGAKLFRCCGHQYGQVSNSNGTASYIKSKYSLWGKIKKPYYSNEQNKKSNIDCLFPAL